MKIDFTSYTIQIPIQEPPPELQFLVDWIHEKQRLAWSQWEKHQAELLWNDAAPKERPDAT